ncbi:PKD domain-containing protein, partial [Acidobacteriota bacterium]
VLFQDRSWGFWGDTDSASQPDPKWQEVTIDLESAGLMVPNVVLRFHAIVNEDEPADAIYLDDVMLKGERMCCRDIPAFTPSGPDVTCAGKSEVFTATILDPGQGDYDAAWSFGDSTVTPVAALDEIVNHTYAAGGIYTARLEAASRIDGDCVATESIQIEVDEPPVFEASMPIIACANDPTVILAAPITHPAVGPMAYLWDFGDGSPLFPVTDPEMPVSHGYPGVAASYTAVLTASDTRLPACDADYQVLVDVVDAIMPSGDLGNSLRVVKSGGDISLEWSDGALTPRRYNVHRTAAKERLIEDESILGQEAIIASPTDQETATETPPATNAIWYYKVAPRDDCTGNSVFPH